MVEPSSPSPADQVRDHAYDGIQEYDNDLPRWWLNLFYLTIVWAVIYFAWYHVIGMPVGPGRLAADQAAAAEARAKTATVLSEDQLRDLSKSPDRIAKGKELFAKSGCVACHGPDGASSANMPGPNLVDRFWINGSRMEQMLDVLAKGRGLMAAQTMLSPDERVNLVIYIVNLNRAGEKPGKARDPRDKDDPVAY